jgi:two-component sensor histidine kinase
VNAQATFPGEAASVSAARHRASEILVGLPPATVEIVLLLVSELASNVVKHARTSFELRVEVSEKWIRIEVEDSGAGIPTAGTLDHTAAVDGRGLRIVDALAADWGVVQQQDGLGKTVWAVVSANRVSAPT